MWRSILLGLALMPVSLFSQQTKGLQPALRPEKASEGETYAVVIGISDYQDPAIPDLRFADKDAEAFANYLRSPAGGGLDGDHLRLLTNEQATAAQFSIALDWLMEVGMENDNVIIYFSGHGDVEAKRISQPGYLLGWDAPSRVYMAGGAVNVRDLQDIISTLSVQNKAKVVVITDACHSGTLSGSEINGAQLTGQNLARQFANEIKILSCQPNEYSIEGEQWGGGRGAFSYNLVNALYGMADANTDLSVTLQEVGRYLEDHVTAEVAPVSQVPMVMGNRTEQLAIVDADLLATLRSGKTNQMQLLSPIESRGMEDEVLAGVDTTVREQYRLFKQALKDKVFFESSAPAASSEAYADAYYERLMAEPKLARLHTTLTRNYAAALQDDAQQVMNTMLKSGLTSEVLSAAKAANIYRDYPASLDRAAELLGSGHYMYAALKARKCYFEGTLQTEKRKKKKQFFEALHWQADMPHAYVALIRQCSAEQADSAEYYAARAMQIAPSWVKPYINLSYFYQYAKQPDKAEELLNRAGQQDSSSILVWYEKAIFYTSQKNFDAAEQWYLKVIAGSGGDICFPCAYNNLGNVYRNIGRWVEAEQQYKKAIRLDSTFANAYGNLGWTYQTTRRYDEAEQQYKKEIQLDSTHTNAYNNLGFVYTITERFVEAEQQYKKAIQLDSTYANAYNNLGSVYRVTRRWVEAEQQYKKAIQLDSTYTNAYINLGSVYRETRHYAEAEQQFKRAIQLDSTFATAYGNMGMIYQETRRYAEAEQQFKKAIQRDSTNYVDPINLALLLGGQNRADEAFENLEKALKNGFNYYADLQQLSDLAPLREQKERWETLMQDAIVPDTTDAKAWNNLGQVYIQAGNYAPAEVAMRNAVALDSRSAPYRSNLGYIYLSLARYPEAETAFKQAIANDSTFANAHNHLGMVLFKTKRPEEANRHFQKALQLRPDYAGAMLGMAYILHAEGRTTEGLGYVEQAIDKGSTMEQLEADEDLSALREQTERWEALMKQYFSDKIYYNLACEQSLQGELDKAFESLGQSLSNGWKDYNWMQQDTDLAPLREQTERWDALMQKYFPDQPKE